MWTYSVKVLLFVSIGMAAIQGATVDFDGDIQFLLYTKNNPKYPQQIFLGDTKSLILSGFKPSRKTIMLIHEWGTGQRSVHITPIKLALLNNGDFNIITVDWHNEATLAYSVARKFIRAIGQYVAKFIKFLAAKGGAKTSDFIIITYGAGAHIAGIAGRDLDINKIIALNPQNKLFSTKNTDILTQYDAKCVYAIYSTINETSKNYIPNMGKSNIFILGTETKAKDYNLGENFSNWVSGNSTQYAIKCDSLKMFLKGLCINNVVTHLGEYSLCIPGKFYFSHRIR